ncbi:hypothetical protein SAMN04489724_2000 [Algoriphagus locisalis]|uniref:Uncharacterized protein n=1 Tax=Algoriphagus locisalis TaxID=305507 RepID=A0A1I7AIU1_9BACT|nr:hypothetical protein SAMN04489724_2000 [Algoriphagus locisalis]
MGDLFLFSWKTNFSKAWNFEKVVGCNQSILVDRLKDSSFDIFFV